MSNAESGLSDREQIVAILVTSWLEGFGEANVRQEIEWMRAHGHPQGADEFERALDSLVVAVAA